MRFLPVNPERLIGKNICPKSLSNYFPVFIPCCYQNLSFTFIVLSMVVMMTMKRA